MKKFNNIRIWQALSFLLFVLAVVSGGGAMAAGTVVNDAPIGDEGPEPATANEVAANEPANPANNDLHIPGDAAAGETLNGTQMSSSQQRREDNIDDEWDKGITQFQPWRTPLLSIARRVARKVNLQNWTVKHARIGGDTLDGRTVSAITQESDGSLKLTPSNFNGSLKAFYKGTTIFCPFIDGYAEDGTTVEGCLELFVVDVTTSYVLVVPVNGKLKSGATAGDTYEVREFGPNGVSSNKGLPANAYLCAGASIAGESQLLITPENYQPRYEEFTVQKKLLNIVWTNDFEKVKKKMPWHVADVKANAIRNYNLRAERTYWMGAKTRFPVVNGDQSVEDAYGSKGILWQVTNSFSVERGKITVGDLIAISKLQHTTFSQSSHSYAFCGSTYMQWLLNLDMGDNKRIIKMEDVKELDIDFKRLKTTFGTTDFTWDQGLDAIGMDEVCVVLDLEGATRYVKIGEKEFTNDMSKGAGEIRDAKREIHYEADCIALRGYNSIIVGPSDIIFSLPDTASRTSVVSAAKLPATPADGTIVALTEDYTDESGDTPVTYKAGTVWIYTASSTSWSEYTGYTSAA
jgi:hypothetical protein